MLLDANLLLYARDTRSAFHERARRWLSEHLNGNVRVGLSWPSLIAFARVITHPRVTTEPLTPSEAWQQIEEWLAAGPAWIPSPTTRHADVLGDLTRRYEVRGHLVPDAHLAALAIEHGLTLCSADTDFARFSEVRWENPVA